MPRQHQKDFYTNTLTKWILGKIIPPTPPAKATPKTNITPPKPNPTSIQTTIAPIEPVKVQELTLRPYQQEAIEEFLKRKKGVLAHATGLGKTFVAMEAIRRIGTPVAIFVPTIAIMEQVWLRRLKEVGWKNVGVYFGQKHQLRPITIFLYQSAIRHPEAVSALRPKLCIFDEVHHCTEKWAELLNFAKLAPYALGLTATINPWEPKYRKIMEAMPLIHTMPIGQARKEGWVAPVEIYSAPAQMTLTERMKYEEYNEIIRKVAIELGTTDPTEWSKMAKHGNPTARRGLWALAKRRTLLSEVKDKLNVLLKIVKMHPNTMTLLFSESIRSVETAKQFLIQNGVKCETYHSGKPKQERTAILKAWEKGEFPTLLSVTSLEEGVDIPSATIGILLASGKTPRKITQRLGRILRKAPGKIARIYVIHCKGTVEDDVLEAVRRAVWKVK